jgi:hypothetical protein
MVGTGSAPPGQDIFRVRPSYTNVAAGPTPPSENVTSCGDTASTHPLLPFTKLRSFAAHEPSACCTRTGPGLVSTRNVPFGNTHVVEDSQQSSGRRNRSDHRLLQQ